MVGSRIALFLATSVGAAACSRPPLEGECPAAAVGDLVISELRGSQSGNDEYSEWIEVYNASGGEIDLAGLVVSISKLDGSSDARLLVRESVPLDVGEYAVLGRQLPGAEPAHVSYGYQDDFSGDLYDSGAVALSSCGVRLDLAVYRNLPTRGTLALDGAAEPSAEANDDAANFCVDDAEDADSDLAGIRGTPRERNRPCSE